MTGFKEAECEIGRDVELAYGFLWCDVMLFSRRYQLFQEPPASISISTPKTEMVPPKSRYHLPNNIVSRHRCPSLDTHQSDSLKSYVGNTASGLRQMAPVFLWRC